VPNSGEPIQEVPAASGTSPVGHCRFVFILIVPDELPPEIPIIFSVIEIVKTVVTVSTHTPFFKPYPPPGPSGGQTNIPFSVIGDAVKVSIAFIVIEPVKFPPE
jgi:hypothetical protein